jgi:hypothetical protein
MLKMNYIIIGQTDAKFRGLDELVITQLDLPCQMEIVGENGFELMEITCIEDIQEWAANEFELYRIEKIVI